MAEAREIGIQDGKAEGEKKAKEEMVKKMLKKGALIEQISEWTDLDK